MILVGVDFDASIFFPGLQRVDSFPGKDGWTAAYEGWSITIDGEHLVFWSPPGRPVSQGVRPELEANGLAESEVCHVVRVPRRRCVERYVTTEDASTIGDVSAPSEALRKPRPARTEPTAIATPEVVPAPVASAPPTEPMPPRNHAPTPLRRPPNAKPASKPTNIVHALSDDEAAAHVKSKRPPVPLATDKAYGDEEEP